MVKDMKKMISKLVDKEIIIKMLIILGIIVIICNYNWKNVINSNSEKLYEEYHDNQIESQIVIAVIDTCINYNLPHLKSYMWHNIDEIVGNKIDDDRNGYIDDISGWNFYYMTNDITQDALDCYELSHGTLVTSIILNECKRLLNGTKRKVRIMPLVVLEKDFTDEETGAINDVIAAIKYADRNGATICNLSINIKQYNKELEEVIEQSKMTFVVSAGNGYPIGVNIDKAKTYPASYILDNVITVANLDLDGGLHYSSNYGPNTVDVAADGTEICVKVTKKGYVHCTGTSFAVPHVVAAVAQLHLFGGTSPNVNSKIMLKKSSTHNDLLNEKIDGGNELNISNIVRTMIQERM